MWGALQFSGDPAGEGRYSAVFSPRRQANLDKKKKKKKVWQHSKSDLAQLWSLLMALGSQNVLRVVANGTIRWVSACSPRCGPRRPHTDRSLAPFLWMASAVPCVDTLGVSVGEHKTHFPQQCLPPSVCVGGWWPSCMALECGWGQWDRNQASVSLSLSRLPLVLRLVTL